MRRAGLYARVSSEEQAEGYSINAQLDAMRQFCLERKWAIDGEYIEPGVSGTTGDRPAFQEALGDAQARRFDVLVTHQLDRFARNLQLQLEVLGQLGEWGVAYVSVTEQIDYSTPQGALFLSMLGAFNEYYVANLRREIAKGKRARAKAGRSNASTIPHGYRRDDDGQDVIDPEASPAVILAFESYATGTHSDTDVAGILNRAGHPPSGRARSGRWTREGVRCLLTNTFYIGQVRYGDELYPGQHEPLISQEIFDQVRALRRSRSTGKGGKRVPGRVYLLQGLARCSVCGLKLVAQTSLSRGREFPYLIDVAARRGFDCSGNGISVTTSSLDAEIGDLVARLSLPADWRGTVLELVKHDDRQAEVARERKRLTEKLRRLRRLYLEVEISETAYKRERGATQARLDALVIPAEPDVLAAGRFLETLADVWEEATPAERKELLGALLDAVIIDVTEKQLASVKPKPAFLALFRQVGDLEEREGCFHLA